MANPVYSDLLWANGNLTPGTHNSSAVPNGYRWVVRTIDVCVSGQTYHFASGFLVWSYADGTNLMGRGDGQVLGGFTYHWDGHQVLNTGDQLMYTSSASSSSLRVSGYQLTLP